MSRRRSPIMPVLAAVAMLIAAASCHADVELPSIFGTNMVLQRDANLPVWGWADAGEQVSVQLGDAPAVTTTADAKGNWRVTLPPTQAGGPVTLKVTGKNALTFENVLIGEVWLCSGQSNMEMTVSRSQNFAEEKAAADYPQIRHIKFPREASPVPRDNINASWTVCSPDTVGSYTACGYFMARDLYKELNVPIGLINSSWGGTRIEPWTPPVGFKQVPALKGIYDQVMLADPRSDTYKARLQQYMDELTKWLDTARASMAAEELLAPSPGYPNELKPLAEHQQPCALYNSMIHCIVPFALKGAIWYQGESNHGEGALYTEKMKALIQGWRTLWKTDELPFYYVQIAPYQYGNENPYIIPVFWEAQEAALQVPHTGMVVTTDVATVGNIHPPNKQAVGHRLALLALKDAYGKTDVVADGPTYKSMAIEGDTIRLTFDNVGSGLASRDGKPLDWFEIIGLETDFQPAKATIEGDTIVLSNPEVKDPRAVRFGWSKLAEPNLMNKEGLPARPFRAGEVPVRDWLKLKVAEAKDYVLVYGMDLAKMGREIVYDTDNSGAVGPFSRIAYFLELQKPGEGTQWVYVSMDAFTEDAKKIGIPCLASKATFQQKVANMNVLSNVQGIVTGEGLTGGNIEFWPNNYGPANDKGIPNASSSLWDFGDQYSAPVDGYGCMQVHNHEAKQTIFAVNNWKAGGNGNIGIGNSNSDKRTRDWTFVGNASSYAVKRLRVLVKPQ